MKTSLLAAAVWMGTLTAGLPQSLSTVQFTSATYSVSETGGVAIVTVERIGEPGGTAYVEYRTVDGTAHGGEDYEEQIGALYFSGETNLTIIIPILNDHIREGDEWFVVEFTYAEPSDTELGSRTNALVTIVDNDFGVEFSSYYYSVDETAGTLTIPVQRRGDPTGAFSVDYAISQGSAIAGEDYIFPQTGTLSFADGQTNQTLTVAIMNDGLVEGFEYFWLVLSNPTAGVPLGSRIAAEVTIQDNDFGVEFTRPRFNVVEGAGQASITVQRRGEPSGAFMVDYEMHNQTAEGGADYLASAGTLNFADGETNRTILIPIIDDSDIEGYESLRVVLKNSTGEVPLGANTEAIVTIVDNDGSPLGNWIQRESGTSTWLYGVTSGNGLFVSVGTDGTILTSVDGRDWTIRTNGLANILYNITFGNGTFVAVGGDVHGRRGGFTSWTRVILTSQDGITWTKQPSGQEGVLFGVIYANATFVAVGGTGSVSELGDCCYAGVVLTSQDGTNWNQRIDGSIEPHNGGPWSFNSVTCGTGIFVAVGDYGGVVISADGTNWVQNNSGTGTGLFAAAWGNGTFVAVGGYDPGVILSSPDGSVWTSRYPSNAIHFAGITFGSGSFVAVSYDRRILTSADGVNWTERDSGPTGGSFSDVTYGNGTFVAVGSSGTILQSAPIVKLAIRFNGLPTLTISGPLGSYQIEYKPGRGCQGGHDCWLPLEMIALTNSPQMWTDTDPRATSYSQRFYRAVLLP